MPSSLVPDTAGPRDQPTFSVRVGGKALPPACAVLALRVQQEVNRIPTAHLVLLDGGPDDGAFALSDKLFAPGAKVEVAAGYRGREERTLFRGLVVKHAVEGRTSGRLRLLITCKDAFVQTTLAPQRHAYRQQTDSQIAQEVVGRYGSLKLSAAATSVTHPELQQYDATDWDFLLLRAAANGLLCFVDDATLTLAKPRLTQRPVVSLQFGGTLLDFDAEIDARDQARKLNAYSWDPATGKLAEAPANEPPAARDLGSERATELAKVFNIDYQLYHDGALPTGELQAWADAALLRQRLGGLRGRVQCYGNAAVKPGTMLEVKGMGERFSGLAYVSGVSHRLEDGVWLTDAQLGLDPRPLPAGLPALGAAPLGSAPAAGLLPGLHGLQLGVVTALEGDPAGEERIAVRLPLLDSQGEEGIRARLLSPDAGKERGLYFRPEIGDEVVVGFLHHDPREAVVLGALYGSRLPVPPPFQTADANNLKGYVSRSKIQVLFDDEKKTLTLTTPGGNKVLLDDEAKGITLEDQHGNKIVLGEDGISLESSKALTLKAATDAKLDAQNVELAAQAQLKATGSGGVELSSSATAVLKGATVMIN